MWKLCLNIHFYSIHTVCFQVTDLRKWLHILIWKLDKFNSQYQINQEQECPLSLYLFNIVLKVLARAIRQQKEFKWIQIGKEKTTIWRWYDSIHEWPQNSTRELLQLIKNSSKVGRYKINLNKSSLTYTNDKQAEKEIRKQLPSQ